MKLSDFDYDLPPDRIAQVPCEIRDRSRLLVIRGDHPSVHLHFEDIIGFFAPGDLLVVNETRVSGFRLNGRKTNSFGIVSCLLWPDSESDSSLFRAIARPLRRLRPGTEIVFGDDLHGKVIDRNAQECRIKLFTTGGELASLKRVIEKYARQALPPYIKRCEKENGIRRLDFERYQTVYARIDGSIAAPTAGLHFTPALLSAIESRGVLIKRLSLSVGTGTFRSIRAEDIESHRMDSERYRIDEEVWQAVQRTQLEGGGRLYIVGTTVMRALESAMGNGESTKPLLAGATKLFIYPGYRFKLRYDGFITNFHLPKSTLLLLVCAHAGTERIKNAYREAIQAGYRFYSYGDSMLIIGENRQ